MRGSSRDSGGNPSDVPFCLLYLLDQGGKKARLVAGFGFGSEHGPANPAFIDLDSNRADDAGWALTRTVKSRTVELFSDLRERFGDLPKGRWSESPRQAISLPLASPDQPHPYGVLIAGVNPHRALDDGYQTFFELAAFQVVTAIRNARASEDARLRVEQLAEIDRAKTAFFSNVSHEFRTPLTLILGPVEDALAKPGAPLAGESLERVHRNSLRLLKLVNTLLDFSRIEAGRTQVKHQPTDLSVFTADLASIFRSLVEKAGLTLTVDCLPLAEPVYVDRAMYEKVVLNLLSNAYKFTFQGGIRVSLDVHEGQVRLVVADTGTGIPEEELPHLFERFHRVEGARGRSYEGSGIGLALVQELVRLHGGFVCAGSRLGKGSRFTVSLPLGASHLPAEHGEAGSTLVATLAATRLVAAPYLDEASSWAQDDALPLPTALEAREVAPPAVALASRQSGRILVVDDNADMREYVGRLLAEQGWEVEAAPDGEAALQSARARLPDLVLTDVMMPGLDGFGLLRALKLDERTRAVPVILLSARAGEEAAIEGMQKGADDYLVKPFSAKQLVSVVAARVEIARARAEAVRARAWLHAQFMQAPVAVCVVTGPDFVFALANPLYLEMVSRKDIVGKTIRTVFPELPPDAPVIQMLQKGFSSGEPFTAEEYCVSLDRNGSGVSEDAYFKLTGQPVRDPSGTVTDIMVVAVEVTVQVHARQRIESLIEELKLADQRKDEFLATLAHELRNPMAAISMALLLLERAEGDAIKAARYRETARRQMQNLVRLVDDLLDVARITRGAVLLRKEEVDLAFIVQNALAATRPVIEARGHELLVTVTSGAFRLDADATRLEQVLVNLLTNAAKYTDPGGALSLRLAREVVNGVPQAVLRVRDTGRGIPANMLEKVFDLFVQVNPALDRSTGGLGLGLTLVKRLVEMHGAPLWPTAGDRERAASS